jgi:glycosyltransferase involved in cell wall biosynthesis
MSNRVLFINGCIYLPGEHALKRTFYLFDKMLQKGCDVHFLTSDFNHYDKTKRDTERFLEHYPVYRGKVTFLEVDSYEKNISPGRFLSNWKFETKALSWLKEHIDAYDVVYISLPTLHLAGSVRKLCEKHGVKIVLDVNDLWPEAFKLVFGRDLIYRILTFPIKVLADRGYRSADFVVAVSDEYRNRALSVNRKASHSKTVYLGAMLDRFDGGVAKYQDEIAKDEGAFWIAYAGTIGASYDIETIIDAAAQLKKEGHTNVAFQILGQGPDEERLKAHAKEIGADNVRFLGFQDYEKMAAYLHKCDLMANCLKKRAAQSIINKISDYYAAGRPVMNSCVSKEMQAMVVDNRVGINYEAESVEAAKEAICHFLLSPERCKEMGENARALAESRFDREKIHMELIDLLLEM